YFERISAIKSPKTKLSLLTFSTREERTFALKTISSLLRSGASYENIQEAIGSNYPLFQQYFFDEAYYPVELRAYFRWYKHNKIINRFPPNEFQIPDYNPYDSRFSSLKRHIIEKTFILWVDGMSIEWLSLLCGQLYAIDAKFSVEKPFVVKALLPTETEFNKQWDEFNSQTKKIDRLDNLNHKGIPDDDSYFSCIEAQFEIIKEIAQSAVLLLQKYERVIITADHGSSRLAALAFHDKPGFKAPENAKPLSYGRFCELPSGFIATVHAENYEYIKIGGKAYYVMKNYEHFSVSGKAVSKDQDNESRSGEIHGGKTPEEYLVPIIVLNRSESHQGTIHITFNPKVQIVYKIGNTTTVKLEFNRGIDTLEANIGDIKGDCKNVFANTWEIQYNNLDKKAYFIEITVNGNLLEEKAAFEVQSKGITEHDLFGGI
ncbi:MAG: BREX-4 system phosphatase PglZ, partial [Tannerellaceae bacterium]|nr:BREX-4 system phosphatase PglZ [Tannerellaceae bacterium]